MEETVANITSQNIFTEAANTMSGMVDMSGNFFTSLWGNPMGKIVITLGLVSGAVGLCYRLFLRKKFI